LYNLDAHADGDGEGEDDDEDADDFQAGSAAAQVIRITRVMVVSYIHDLRFTPHIVMSVSCGRGDGTRNPECVMAKSYIRIRSAGTVNPAANSEVFIPCYLGRC